MDIEDSIERLCMALDVTDADDGGQSVEADVAFSSGPCCDHGPAVGKPIVDTASEALAPHSATTPRTLRRQEKLVKQLLPLLRAWTAGNATRRQGRRLQSLVEIGAAEDGPFASNEEFLSMILECSKPGA